MVDLPMVLCGIKAVRALLIFTVTFLKPILSPACDITSHTHKIYTTQISGTSCCI